MRFVLTIAAISAFSTAAGAATLKVPLDQSARITLSRPARDVVVANPKVADVTVIDSRNIVVMGKGYGATTLLALDAAGRTVADHRVVVSSPEVGEVSFYRGAQVQTFACEARCEPVTEAPAAPAAQAKAATP